eukprot:461157-Pelagomonas_calceolata.AAC.1
MSSSSSSSFCSHYVLRSRHDTSQRTSAADRVRQPHQLNPNQRHVHLLKIKYFEDRKLGKQSEAAQRQHADLFKLINVKAVTLRTILLGMGGTCNTEHTLNQFKQLGLGYQCAVKLARKLHAHSVMFANKHATARHALEKNDTVLLFSDFSQPGSGAGCFQ